jgi:hypothetical protein
LRGVLFLVVFCNNINFIKCHLLTLVMDCNEVMNCTSQSDVSELHAMLDLLNLVRESFVHLPDIKIDKEMLNETSCL